MGFLDIFGKKKKKEPYIPFEHVKTDKGDYEEFYGKLRKSSLVLLIVGKRGSGKTSLGMKLIEFFHKETKRKCYTLGYENSRLPWWLKKVDSIEDEAIKRND